MLSSTVLSFVLVALLVVTASRAAFTSTTSNGGNSVGTSSVTLSDDDTGTAMFTVSDLVSGAPVDRCIHVTYSGSVDPLPIKLYLSGAPTGPLAPYLTVRVDVGAATSDPFPGCSSFVPTSTLYAGNLDALPTTLATGVSTWDPTGPGESRTFRFRVDVPDTPAAQGQNTSFGLTWETRSS